MTPLLLIDANNMIHRGHHVFSDLMTSNGYRIGALYGFTFMLRNLLYRYDDHVAVVVWDGGRSSYRRELHEGYKSGRRSSEEELPDGFVSPVEQAAMALELCLAMGVHTVRVRGVEADDAIALISRSCESSVIYSTDKDFYQLVRPGHKVHRSIRDKVSGEDIIINHLNFQEKLGISSSRHYRLMHAMCGDSSDSIPGVRGVGPKTAYSLVHRMSYGDLNPTDTKLDELYQMSQDGNGYERRLANEWETLILNLKLIDLWDPNALESIERFAVLHQLLEFRPVVNRTEVHRLLSEWEFNTEVDKVNLTFRSLNTRRKIIRRSDLNLENI